MSNHRLQVYNRYFKGRSPIKTLLDKKIKVTLNSDDPAYFFMGNVDASGRALDADCYDGYLNANYQITAKECQLTVQEVAKLAVNSFSAAIKMSPQSLTQYIN